MSPQSTHAGRRVLITGGSGAIGRALCTAFAARGARVAFSWFRHHQGRRDTLAAISAVSDIPGEAFRTNLRQPEAAQDLAEEVIAALGGIDIFISNAGAASLKPTMELTPRQWQAAKQLNVTSFLRLCQILGAQMPAGGRILAISSSGSVHALPQYGAMGASKAAIESLVRHLSLELGPRQITINAIRPGLVETPALRAFAHPAMMVAHTLARTPNQRLTEPQDVAALAVFLASPGAAMIQGQTLVVDGGYSIHA